MSILDRLSRLLRANVNDLISKAEDPAKIIDQALRDMRGDGAPERCRFTESEALGAAGEEVHVAADPPQVVLAALEQPQLLRRERLQRASTHDRLFQDALIHQTVVVIRVSLIAPDGRLLPGQDETTVIRTCVRFARFFALPPSACQLRSGKLWGECL